MQRRNERGPIADTYDELQGLPSLREAIAAYRAPRASKASTVRTLFQCTEVALLTAADVLDRAAADVTAGRVARAAAKLTWVHGFNVVVSRIGLAVECLTAPDAASIPTRLSIQASPAL